MNSTIRTNTAKIIHTQLSKTPAGKEISKVQSDPTAKSTADAQRKLRIHIICIMVAGAISTTLYILKIGNAEVLGFGPAAPSIAQEIFDRIFRL